MKTIGIIFATIIGLNLLALTINLLLGNPYTGTITFFTLFATGAWIIGKAIKS